ncbi:MAG: heparinase II/III family protein [Phycisphaerae bacterium]|nr:heparinase II/III family protein [Phycisphaerae bacterium]
MTRNRLIVLLMFAGMFCFCNCAPPEARAAAKKPAGKSAKPRKPKRKRIPLFPWKGDILSTLRKEHPRLLFTAADEKRIKKLAKDNEQLAGLITLVTKSAERILSEPEVKLAIPPKSKRHFYLLSTSRVCLGRVTTLAMAFRLTGDRRFFERARKEMLAAAGFWTWNPKHFLDVGEMCCALGIGYDWLYDELSKEDRAIIRRAIVEKALKPSLRHYHRKVTRLFWEAGRNNWNLVCNGGLLIGALAIAEDEPKLSREIVSRALSSVKYGLSCYLPDGAWPEGPGYWNYGSVYNALFFSALETSLGDLKLYRTEMKAFSKSGSFIMHMIGPNRKPFTYADCGSGKWSISPAMFYLARRFNQPAFAWFEWKNLRRMIPSPDAKVSKKPGKKTSKKKPGKKVSYGRRYHSQIRLLAMAIAWFDERGVDYVPDKLPLDAFFRGQQDLVAMRGSWEDANALFVGFKGGNNKASHGHMDIGSFVLDADGVRWAIDLGADHYRLPGYSNKTDGGPGWRYYRRSAKSHNTLVIGDKLQLAADSESKVVAFHSSPTRSHAVVDMSKPYRRQAKKLLRGVAMLGRQAVLVQDEITAPENSEIRWGMVTRAKIKIDGRKAVLTQDGKTLHVEVVEPVDAVLKIVSTAPPTKKENPNRGTRMLAAFAKPNGKKFMRIVVLLKPVGKNWKETPTPKIQPLANWKGKKVK